MNSTLRVTGDDNGILVITIDLPGRPMNVITPQFTADLEAAVERLAADPGLRGAVITSGKRGFVAGADILDMVNAYGDGVTLAQGRDFSQRLNRLFRRMETCGKPVAAAINGLALGGGMELALACHYRVLTDEKTAFMGLPEVTIGLLPGAGGTQRVPRLAGIEAGIQLLTEGRRIAPREALALGLVHALVPPDEVLERARRWLLEVGDPVQPWDRPGFTVRGGASLLEPTPQRIYSQANASLAQPAWRCCPAPLAILSCVFEGAALPMATALEIEACYFARLLADPVSRNLMRTRFVHKGRLDKLPGRPPAIPYQRFNRVGVIGTGAAAVDTACAVVLGGLPVTLLGTNLADAQAVQATCAARLKGLSQVPAPVEATADPASLAGCDFLIGVGKAPPFSDKAGGNGATIAVTGTSDPQPAPDTIALYFPPPGKELSLVEVAAGTAVAPQHLAHVLDFVAQLRRTPIIVSAAGGYTGRVFGAFLEEGMRLLAEGVGAALIENAARMAGMAQGPLAAWDDRGVSSFADVCPGLDHPGPMSATTGYTFYESAADGHRRLRRDLPALLPTAVQQPDVSAVQTRLLTVQALEAVRCIDDGVVTGPVEADVGSVFGWGFPAWTGGVISYIETVGLAAFVDRCALLTTQHGERFAAPDSFRWRAARNELFHTRISDSTTVSPNSVEG